MSYLVPFLSYTELSKVVDFNLPHLHFVPHGGDSVQILQRSLALENYSSRWAVVWRCL